MSVYPIIKAFHVAKEKALEGWLAEVNKRFKVTCGGPGCAVCCRMIVMATWSEALEIVASGAPIPALALHAGKRQATLIREAFWKPGGDQRENLKTVCARWAAYSQPCAFQLVDGKCSIYEIRPIHCSAYLVTSTPELCHRGAATLIDNTEILKVIVGMDRDLQRHFDVKREAVALGEQIRRVFEDLPTLLGSSEGIPVDQDHRTL